MRSILFAFAAAGFAGLLAQEGKVVHISGQSGTYKEIFPGVSKCALWGDADRGPAGAFTRFAPGQMNRMHTHTHDVRIVVLEGAYIYKAGGQEIRVGPKEYLFIPGGTPHVSRGDDKAGALFYEETPGKFDVNYVEK
jgi:mannose-6-phosphate isomerase-like protein (cupin superfamily)